jgi:hypothetical protein
LPPQVWNDGLAQLNYLQTDATLGGRWSSPKLRIDTDRLVQHYKQQLLAAGQAALVKAIDEQLARGEAAVNQVVDSTIAKAEAAVDRQAEKVEQAVDRTAQRAEQAVDQATTRVDAAVAQGTTQVAQTQQRVEQSVSQAQQAVQQWQGQFGSAGRYLQENVAAGALTNPLGAALNPAQPVAQPEAAESYTASRRGPPQLLYDETPAAAPTENVAQQQPQQQVPSNVELRYPDSVRNYAIQALPDTGATQTVAQTPDSLPAGYSAPNQPASFQAPPSRLELGYEQRLAAQQAAVIQPQRPAVRPSAPPPSATVNAPPPAEKNPSRIAAWSRGVTGKVKSVMPWPRKEAAPSEAIASDTPVEQAAVQPTAPEPAGDNSQTPWYRRFWR